MTYITTPEPTKKRGWIARNKALIITGGAALLVGALIGGASQGGASSEASPRTVTKTVEVPAPAETIVVTEPAAPASDVCKSVATRLWAMVESYNQNVGLSYTEAIQIIVREASSSFPSASEISRATSLVEGATQTIQGFTAEITGGLGADYIECAQ